MFGTLNWAAPFIAASLTSRLPRRRRGMSRLWIAKGRQRQQLTSFPPIFYAVAVSRLSASLFQIEPLHSTLDRDHCAGDIARPR
jgi:hypothetical protein